VVQNVESALKVCTLIQYLGSREHTICMLNNSDLHSRKDNLA